MTSLLLLDTSLSQSKWGFTAFSIDSPDTEKENLQQNSSDQAHVFPLALTLEFSESERLDL